jgi:hypothetical protein
MVNSNKILIVLVLISLVASVIGSWLVFNQISNIECPGPSQTMTQAQAVLRYADSGKVTLTVAPVGPRNIVSSRVLIDIQ